VATEEAEQAEGIDGRLDFLENFSDLAAWDLTYFQQALANL